MENWGFIEADFQREYRINLETSLAQMSWRRFLVLLGGLSANSVFILHNSNEAQEQKVITDPVEASRAVDRVWG